MKPDYITERLHHITKQLISDRRSVGVLLTLGILALGMIIFSDKKEEADEGIEITENDINYSDYSMEIEQKLEKILSAIDGVGKADVMVSLASTEEYIYAEAEKSDSSRKECEYVIIENDGGEEALVKKIVYPEISGVVVVCKGGGSDKVRECVYNTLVAALGITSDKIYVTKME